MRPNRLLALAHAVGPGVVLRQRRQRGEHALAQGRGGLGSGEAGEQRIRQLRQLRGIGVESLAQGRQRNDIRRRPIEQVPPEAVAAQQRRRRPIGGRHHAPGEAALLVPVHRREGALLEQAQQLGLDWQ